MSMSPRARWPATAGRAAPGAMEVVSTSTRGGARQLASTTKPPSLLARVAVFVFAFAVAMAVWRARNPADDLWRELTSDPPAQFCAGARGTSLIAVCAHGGVDDKHRFPRNSRAALKKAAEAFDCVELDVSATLDGHLVALHGRRGPREQLEMLEPDDEEAPSALTQRRPPQNAFVGDYTLRQVRAMRWLRRRAPVYDARAQERQIQLLRQEEGPLLVSEAIGAVLAAWGERDAGGNAAGAAAAAAAAAADRTVILDVKRPEGAAAANVTFERVAKAAAAAASEAGCGRRCVLWAADDDASRALAKAAEGAAAAAGEERGSRPRIGYVVAYAGRRREGKQEERLVPRLEGAAQVAAVDAAELEAVGAGARSRRDGGRRGGGGGGGAVEAAPFESAGQTLVAFVVDGGRSLRAAAQGGAHAVVTNVPLAVRSVLAAWEGRCNRG